MIVTHERCRNGLKEVQTRLTRQEQGTLWTQELSNKTHITRFAKTIEPHEQRSVYVGESSLAGGGEGIYAKRSFLPGEISYFITPISDSSDGQVSWCPTSME